MRLFAVTGSIGSGKSQVASILESLGALIIDADQLAREVVAPGSEALEAVVKEFGPSILSPKATLDRKRLGEMVFADPLKRAKLEGILHPAIRALFEKRLRALEANPANKLRLVFYVVPLLFESKLSYPKFEKIIVVSAPREVCIERIVKRDNSSRELAAKKYAAQISIEEKEKRADIVIKNDCDQATLEERTKALYETLSRSA